MLDECCTGHHDPNVARVVTNGQDCHEKPHRDYGHNMKICIYSFVFLVPHALRVFLHFAKAFVAHISNKFS